MLRCIDLAQKAGGRVRLNPNVGAVLVHNDQVIGEGYHERYGGPHAEVNAINSVAPENKHLIADSTLYVSLEPCNIHGKTPPCAMLILKNNIKKLVVGCEDPNPRMAGSSLSFLASKGVHITTNIKQSECEKLIQPFKVNILNNRPFITIKFAQSKDFFMSKEGEQTWLSNRFSKIWSHQLRSENHGILIGSNTAVIDNPALTNRLYSGDSPLRICIDRKNSVPDESTLLTDSLPTLMINETPRKNLKEHKDQWTFDLDLSILLSRLYKEKQIGRLIVEGGAYTIGKFLDNKLWDQAMIINTERVLGSGIKSPNIIGKLEGELNLESDKILTISNNLC
nr:bifunctional diaminohydroxyphosphoribosylaminopyrimidine deaminase/5-amino-6-(5-phosphoribosylamino)uracil reductase RibD [Portibacter lacus]